MPLLSIIIPTFNSQLTIGRCLESLSKQTFRDFEILVIDGASTDNTIGLAKELQPILPAMTLVSEKDEGTYDAMNKGIGLSSGTWLYFLGSDDWLYNEFVLQHVFETANLNSVEVVYGNVFRTGLRVVYDGRFDDKKLLQKNICHQAIFFKKNVFSITGYYNLKYRILSDWDHNLKWFYHPAVKKEYIDLVVANYTDHGISGNKEDDRFQADKFLNVYNYAYPFLNSEMRISIFKLVIYSFRVRKQYLKMLAFAGGFLNRNIKLMFQKKTLSY